MGWFSRKGKQQKDDEFFSIFDNDTEKAKATTTHPSHALTPDEIMSDDKQTPPPKNAGVSPMETLKRRMQQQKGDEVEEKNILDRVRAYTTDEDGHNAAENTDPIYRLESVADIIKRKNAEKLSELQKKFYVPTTVVDKTQTAREKKQEVKETPKDVEVKPAVERESLASQSTKGSNEAQPEKTEAFKKMVSDANTRSESDNIFEDLFPGIQPKTSADITPKLPDISDIDTRAVKRPREESPSADTATIRFVPIGATENDPAHISVSSSTRPIDITDEFGVLPDEAEDEAQSTKLEESDFERFTHPDEYTCAEDGKRLIRSLSVKKRSMFFRAVLSGLISLISALFIIPPLSELYISKTFICAIICEALLLVSTLINYDMFLSFKKLTAKSCSSDAIAALSSIGALILGGIALIGPHDVSKTLLLANLTLFARALAGFWSSSCLLSNLRQITGPNPKKAVILNGEHAVTHSMAMNAIEGDALVAMGRKTRFVEDFMKYSTYSPELSGKIGTVFFFALAVSVIIGLGTGTYFGSYISGLECAALVLCISATPILFFADSLPNMTAASRLNRKGAMIAGKTGALKLEQANAVVISSRDIFPAGTVTFHDMKFLADNNVDQTIMRAASLTDALDSTLAPIFNQIAGTNTSYTIPDSDTVKYEERLGISGWVDNEPLFIGNRTLMEAHGIEVPSVEVDKKLLRQGYFPVYVASKDTACALVIIQYHVDPNVARELKRLTNLGVTILVNNCDPNISEAMICDYIGLYEDSVKIMSNTGVHMYRSVTHAADRCPAPAAFRGSSLGFVSILNCASRIKRSSLLLTICYILAACIGVVVFSYAAFMGVSAPSGSTVLIYELIATAISIILFITQKP